MIYKLAWWIITRHFREHKNIEAISHRVRNEDYILIRSDHYFQLAKKGLTAGHRVERNT